MFNLTSLRNIGVPIYLFIYLIIPYSAITQTIKVDLRRNLEEALNTRDLNLITEIFRNFETSKISKRFSKIITEFPDSQWKIKKLESSNPNQELFLIKVVGKKIVNEEPYILESKFNYLFSLVNGKINEGVIKKLFTIIRNDDKKIGITFKIPDKVLTGAKYDIDIILDKPLEDIIIAGGIKTHKVDPFIDQEIVLDPLVSGGIFKMTRAPSEPGIQLWSGIIAHPMGIITFTKSIDIVEKI